MRVLSGIQPTGRFHWGNYFGAIRQYIDLQSADEAYYFIANLHALTTIRDKALLQQAESLRIISNMAVGTDNIDLSFATAQGIPVGNTPGVLTETTADFAFALLMAAARRVVDGDRGCLTPWVRR